MINLQEKTWVIIGDLIDSRNIKNRKKTQQNLNFVLEKVNKKYCELILVPFKITLGDEFVGVLNSYHIILDLMQYLDSQLEDIQIRYGIGYGKFESPYKGKGYKQALLAVETAKKKKFRVHLSAHKEDGRLYILLNIILHLYFHILSNYNSRQKYILYQLIEGKTQQEIARQIGSSQSSISQSLDRINWHLLLKVHDSFKQLAELSMITQPINNWGDYIAIIGALPVKLLNESVFINLLNFINLNYRDIIKARFTLTSLSPEDEDYYEFQSLLYNKGKYLFDFFHLLIDLFILIDDLHLGLGIGRISTEFNEQAIGMDGNSFYRARESVSRSLSENMPLYIKTDDNSRDWIYSLLFRLFFEFVRRWSFKQFAVIRFKEDKLIQNKIREKMKLKSQSTVAKHLKTAGWQEYNYIINNIVKFLDK